MKINNWSDLVRLFAVPVVIAILGISSIAQAQAPMLQQNPSMAMPFQQQGAQQIPTAMMPPQQPVAMPPPPQALLQQAVPAPQPQLQPVSAQAPVPVAEAQPQPEPQAAPVSNPIADVLSSQNEPQSASIVPVTPESETAKEETASEESKPAVQEEVRELKPLERSVPGVEITDENQPYPPINMAQGGEEAESPVITNIDKKQAGEMLDMPITAEPETNQGINMDLDPTLVGTGEGEDEFGALPEEPELPYEEQLRIRLKEIEQQGRAEAFERTKRSVLPLETYQIRDLIRRLKVTQEAIQKPVLKPPTPQNVIKTISFDPSAKSETVRLYVGNVTALNVVDMTGAPWPIVDVAYGGNFDVKPPDAGGSILRITPLRDYARGNMIIRLLKLNTPITLLLEAGGDTVHHRFDARIPEYGPNARMPIVNEGIKMVAGDSFINSVLEGVTPNGGEKLKVEGVDGRTSAYRVGTTLYVRTPLTMLSPSWRGSATSADGMNVYVLAEAPVLLFSDDGKLARARISARSKSLGEQ